MLRYVVLNPVRTGMVAHPADYEWSSYRALAGLEPAPDWLDASWLLGLDKKLSKARKIYRDFVDEKCQLLAASNGLACDAARE